MPLARTDLPIEDCIDDVRAAGATDVVVAAVALHGGSRGHDRRIYRRVASIAIARGLIAAAVSVPVAVVPGAGVSVISGVAVVTIVPGVATVSGRVVAAAGIGISVSTAVIAIVPGIAAIARRVATGCRDGRFKKIKPLQNESPFTDYKERISEQSEIRSKLF